MAHRNQEQLVQVVHRERMTVKDHGITIPVVLSLDEHWAVLDESPAGFDPVRHGRAVLDELMSRIERDETSIEARRVLMSRLREMGWH
jgi:hypothetical protein